MTDDRGLDESAAPVIEVDDIVVDLDGVTVLDGLSLSVLQGEFVALLGANGAGKTTLLRAMLGLTPVASGAVRLLGTPLARFSQWQSLALVPQRLPHLGAVPVSVAETVAAGRVGRRPLLWPGARDRQAVREAIAAVDLTDRHNAPLDTLSGGQQRRALIARALAGGANVFFLDEPTAGVDAESQQRLADLLGRMSESGATVVLVTHELGPLAPLVTRTVVLAAGRIAYDGPTPPAAYLHDHIHHHSHDDPHRTDPGPLMES